MIRVKLGSDLTIAVIAPDKPGEFFDLLWQGVRRALSELAIFGVQGRLFSTGGHDPAAARKILMDLLDCGQTGAVDAIVLLPAHAEALNDLIDEHVAGNRPVITFNSDAPASRRTAFVGADPSQAGGLAGELLTKFMRGQGRLASFPGRLSNHHLARRHDTMLRYIAEHAPGIQETICQEGMSDLAAIALDVLSGAPFVDGVYVGTASVFQVAEALERLGRRPVCIGFDDTEAVRPYLARGTVWAVIEQSRYQQGYLAVQRAMRELTGTVGTSGTAYESRPVLHIPSTVVLSSHLDEGVVLPTLNDFFEDLITQRTGELQAYKKKLESANRELLARVETDPLTGLLNHRKFHEVLTVEVARARRGGFVSVLMLDLDAFKLLNDTYGHPVGDEGLKAVANVLRACCRSTDFCARYGGDEFSVILPATDGAAANHVRQRILDQMAGAAIQAGGHSLPLSVSIGAATFPNQASTATELIVLADNAMYRDKHGSLPASAAGEMPEGSTAFRVFRDLMSALDKRDDYTGRHSRMVAAHAVQLGEKLSLDGEELKRLQLAALLHDIGKIGVPERILRKPGKLTHEEFESVKQHLVYARMLLSAVEGSEPIVDAVCCQAERWDGSGYPSGLSGDRIPLFARIIKIVEAYWAMRSDRPYRKALSKSEAVGQLRQRAGRDFDPVLIGEFLELLDAEASGKAEDDILQFSLEQNLSGRTV
ncbi:MAG: HD domain-containing phosphohydrolase [Bryobacteraceae bacterium]